MARLHGSSCKPKNLDAMPFFFLFLVSDIDVDDDDDDSGGIWSFSLQFLLNVISVLLKT